MKTIHKKSLIRGSAILFLFASIAAICMFVASSSSSADADFVVATSGGQLRGVARSTGGAEFLGIPYAQPPVSDLRWREPMPVKPWSGIRDAVAFGAPCAQPLLGMWNARDALSSKEDCLFLNVITPVWPPKEPLPVMLWIHGGSNTGGTASSALYKDGTLAQHGVLLVTVNYRLGVFGFFAHPELTRESPHHASGNYGLLDQIAALRWVVDNIAKFGGDSSNITLFGQSAGAQDTGILMTSPLSKDKFQRAIAESGSPFNQTLSLAEAEQAGQKFAASLKAPSDDGAIKFLRQLSKQDLLKGVARHGNEEGPSFGPIVDAWVIPRWPVEIFAAGQEAPIPMMIGTTTREFSWTGSLTEARKTIQEFSGNHGSQALTLYGLAGEAEGTSDPFYGSGADQWVADIAFRCPVLNQAALHQAAHQSTYEYEFDHAIPGQEAQGAIHSADLPYVFGYYPKTGNIGGKFEDADFKLADMMETYWTNFAKKGNPNGGALSNWPEFAASQSYIQFMQDGSVKTAAALRKPYCDLYREILKERTNKNK